MRVTMTIEEETESQVRIERPETGETVTTSGELPAEAKPISAGGPPTWLLQELQGMQGMAAEQEEAQTSTEPIDAGPAPAADGNGLASIHTYFARG
ncbi:MAG TPA: hypothetical protein VF236_06050 [Gaiellaceae bacterium]